MSKVVLFIFIVATLAGSIESCKHPTEPSSGCDTCVHSCDTCDTTHHVTSGDSSSHAFTWSIYHLPTNQVQEGDGQSCWVFDRTNIFVSNTYLYHFDGSVFRKKLLWSSEGGEFDYLTGFRMFAFDTADFWMSNGSLIFHFDGTRYKGDLVGTAYRLENTGVWHLPEDGGMSAAWGTSSKDMFFVGDKGTILHFDGTTWIKYPKVTEQNLTSVWGTSHSDIWACGYNQTTGTTALVHFNGSSWSRDSLGELPPPVTGGMYATWSCDSAGHRVNFVNGGFLFRRTDNGRWWKDSGSQGGTDIALDWFTGNSANDFLLSGGWGLTMHWNGRSWHRFDELFDEGAADFTPHAAHMNGNTACIVGRKNGNSWIAIGQRQ